MMSTVSSPVGPECVETALRFSVPNGNAAADTIVPILRYALTSDDNSLFGDEVIARVRGMLRSLAVQLLDHGDQPVELGEQALQDARVGMLSNVLLESAPLLSHLHALAIEWQLTQQMERRFGLDPVLPPLLQELLSSQDAEFASASMLLLAAQARHGEAQRRMTLPILELPAEILHILLAIFDENADRLVVIKDRVDTLHIQVRRDYDEPASRLGIASKIVSLLGGEGHKALSIRNSGITLFLSALANGAGIDRDATAVLTHETQVTHFISAMRTTGLKTGAVLEQCFNLHPDFSFPEGLEGNGIDFAATFLANGGSHFGN